MVVKVRGDCNKGKNTYLNTYHYFYRELAQLVSAGILYIQGCGFKSHTLYYKHYRLVTMKYRFLKRPFSHALKDTKIGIIIHSTEDWRLKGKDGKANFTYTDKKSVKAIIREILKYNPPKGTIFNVYVKLKREIYTIEYFSIVILSERKM